VARKKRHATGTPTQLGQRAHDAASKACESYAGLRRMAEKVSREIDEVTSPHGIVTTELSEEDSMVHAVASAIAVNQKG
jgi:hypothetical protein